eukprot:5695571-Pyramimonas_sp.AAC.1
MDSRLWSEKLIVCCMGKPEDELRGEETLVQLDIHAAATSLSVSGRYRVLCLAYGYQLNSEGLAW